MGLSIKVQEVRSTHFMVKLDGRLDSQTFGQLDSAFKMLFGSAVRSVQLDLELLSYISSMGLRSIMLAARQARAKGASFAVVRPQPPVRAVLEIGKALPAESVFASVEEADRYLDHIQKTELALRTEGEGGMQL